MITEGARRNLAAAASGAALFLLAVVTGMLKLRSGDYWWHLRTGYWIAEMGGVPSRDVYTYTVAGAPYLDAHWLFQLALAGIHSLGGHDGVVLAKAGLAVALVAILATVGWRREHPFVTALGLGMLLLVASERFLARPEMPSFILLASILALLERHERRGDAWIYAIVPLQLLWVNIHGLFALGIAVCAIYLVSGLYRAIKEPERRGHARRLATVLLLAALISLVNPNLLEGALYPIQQLGMIGPVGDDGIARGYILELLPVWHAQVPGRMLIVPAVLGLACAIAIAANWRGNRNKAADVLLFLAFLCLGLLAHRNLPLSAIVAAPLLVRNANEWLDRHPLSARARNVASATAVVLLLAVSFDVSRGSFHSRIGTLHEPGLGYVDLYVPEGAVDWIERERPAGPIAHHMWDGGYLNWRLYPGYKVMVDGRLEIYGAKRLASLRFITPRDFRRLDDKFHFGVVLLSPAFHDPRLIAWFFERPGWRLVHADVAGVLFVRAASDGSFRWPAVDVDAPDFLPALIAEPSMVDKVRRRTRLRLLFGLRRWERLDAETKAIMARYPRDFPSAADVPMARE